MREFNVTIQMDNAAFEYAPGREIKRILQDVIDKIYDAAPLNVGHYERTLQDFHGNTVGSAQIIEV